MIKWIIKIVKKYGEYDVDDPHGEWESWKYADFTYVIHVAAGSYLSFLGRNIYSNI